MARRAGTMRRSIEGEVSVATTIEVERDYLRIPEGIVVWRCEPSTQSMRVDALDRPDGSVFWVEVAPSADAADVVRYLRYLDEGVSLEAVQDLLEADDLPELSDPTLSIRSLSAVGASVDTSHLIFETVE